MRGDSDEKIPRDRWCNVRCLYETARIRGAQRVLAQVHAASLLRKRDIETVVDENTRCCAGRVRPFCDATQCVTCKRRRLPSGKIFLAKLNPIDAGSG